MYRTLYLFVFMLFAVALSQAAEEDDDYNEFRYLRTEQGYIVKMIGSPAFRHDAMITSIRCMPDGKTVVIGSRDETIRLWDLKTGEELRCIAHTRGFPERFALNRDASQLLSVTNQGQVALWSTGETPELIREFKGFLGNVYAIAWSPDESVVYAGGYHKTAIQAWEVATGKPLRGLQLPQERGICTSLVIPSANRLVAACRDGRILEYDLKTATVVRTFEGHSKEVSRIVLSPDKKLMLSCGSDGNIGLWDIASGIRKAWFEKVRGNMVTNAAFFPDGKRAAVVAGGFLHTVDLVKMKMGRRFRVRMGALEGVDVTLDGQKILCGGWDHALHTWSGEEVLPDMKSDAPRGELKALAYSPDGRYLAGGGWDHTIHIWNTSTGIREAVLKGHLGLIHALQWTPDSKQLISGGDDHFIIVWDVAAKKELRRIKRLPLGLRTMQLAPDAKLLYVGGVGKKLLLFDISDGTLLKKISHIHTIEALVLDPMSLRVAAGGGQGKSIAIRDAESFTLQTSLAADSFWVGWLAFSKDGNTLVSTNSYDRVIQIWDTSTAKKSFELSNHKGWISSTQYLGETSTLISVSHDATIRFWDSDTGKEEKKIRNLMFQNPNSFGSGISALALAPGGKNFAVANRNGTVCMYLKK